jgi:NADH-quinone oxidoreductase subunit L
MWVIGIVTSLLTATYMFRLVFLAFHGERRAAHGAEHPEEEEPAAHGHGSHGHGAHAHAPHDAPPSMAIPLIVLAAGSVLAGYVGVPHALGGSNRIEGFLHPSFEAHTVAGETPAAEPEPAGEAESHDSTELMLMAISTGIAIAGIGIATYFWLRNRRAADALAERLKPVHRLLLNKYYVDEIYNAVIVQPIKRFSTIGLWRGADAGLIDGAVNGVGLAVRGSSTVLRRVQTGSVRTYAAGIFVGVVLIVGYYLVR